LCADHHHPRTVPPMKGTRKDDDGDDETTTTTLSTIFHDIHQESTVPYVLAWVWISATGCRIQWQRERERKETTVQHTPCMMLLMMSMALRHPYSSLWKTRGSKFKTIRQTFYFLRLRYINVVTLIEAIEYFFLVSILILLMIVH